MSSTALESIPTSTASGKTLQNSTKAEVTMEPRACHGCQYFTTQLYNQLGGDYLITHQSRLIPSSSRLTTNGGYCKIDKAVGNMINWYNVQASGSFINISLDKIVIRKPATKTDADYGYMMSPTYLNTFIQQTSQKNWSAGIMLWKYSNAASGMMQEARKGVFPLPA
ncbi:hypothetical protein C8R44DRAFT_892248 [Mycena epipterygia]|nr:hypothetical protein C8R44DRAFT_892248 [Mycena epipterygia]